MASTPDPPTQAPQRLHAVLMRDGTDMSLSSTKPSTGNPLRLTTRILRNGETEERQKSPPDGILHPRRLFFVHHALMPPNTRMAHGDRK